MVARFFKLFLRETQAPTARPFCESQNRIAGSTPHFIFTVRQFCRTAFLPDHSPSEPAMALKAIVRIALVLTLGSAAAPPTASLGLDREAK
jgi:hypothetical protein